MMKNSSSILALIFTLLTAYGLSAGDLSLDRHAKTLTAPVGGSYEWFLDGQLLSSCDQKIVVRTGGTYQVSYVDEAGNVKAKELSIRVDQDGKVYRIVLIGDSTMQAWGAGSYPQKGWGQAFQPFFDAEKVQVINRARSGRSAKSFYEESDRWPLVREELLVGDFVIIQFGINDRNKRDPDRYTDPNGASDEPGSTKYYLKKYVDESLEKGAYPILTTPIRRNGWSGGVSADGYRSYAQAARDLAVELGVPLLDVDSLGRIVLDQVGEVYATTFWYKDAVHPQETGVNVIAKTATEGLRLLAASDATIAEIVPFIKETAEISVSTTHPSDVSISKTEAFPEGLEMNVEVIYNDTTHFFVGWFDASDSLLSNEPRYRFNAPGEAIALEARLSTDFSKVDCNNEYEGGAVTDVCGACTGGSTGKLSCHQGIDTAKLYEIRFAHSDLCFTTGQRYTQEICSRSPRQIWKMELAEDGLNYKIRHAVSGLFLDNKGGAPFSLTEEGSRWRLELQLDGSFAIIFAENLDLNMGVPLENQEVSSRVALLTRKSGSKPGYFVNLVPSEGALSTQEKINVVQLFPNPAKEGQLFFTLDQQLQQPSIKILDLNGNVLYTGRLSFGKNALDVSTFSKGLYLVQVLDGARMIESGRFVVN